MALFERIGDKDRDKKVTLETIENVADSLFKEKEKEKQNFTWKGFYDTIVENIGDNIYNPLNPFANRFKALYDREGPDIPEGSWTSAFEDLSKGVDAGQLRGAYGVSRFLLSGIDYAFDSDFVSKIDNIYEKYRPDQPETLKGEITALISEYALPGFVAGKIIDRSSKILKPLFKGFNKYIPKNQITTIASRVGYGASIVGATDFISYNPDSIVPFQETKLKDTEDLEGRDKIIADFNNRLLYGSEGALIGGAFPLLGKPLALGFKYGIFKPTAKVAGIGLKAADKLVVSPVSYLLSKDPIVLPTISKTLRGATNNTLQKVIAPVLTGQAPLTKLPAFEKWRMFSVHSSDPIQRRLKRIDNFLSWFRSGGKDTPAAFKLKEDANRYIKRQSREIDKYLEGIEKKAYELAKQFQKQYDTKTSSPAQQEYYLDSVLAYLKGDFGPMPDELLKLAKPLKKQLDEIKQTFGELLPKGELKNAMIDNINGYMKKSFAIFTNASYKPSKEIKNKAVDWIQENVVSKNIDLVKASQGDLRKTAENLVNDILQGGKVEGRDPLDVLNYIAKKRLRMDDFIKTGEELPTAIKQLLGEEKNLRGSVLSTVTTMITESTRKKMYDSIVDVGLREGWLFSSEAKALAAGIPTAQRIGRVPSLKNLGTKLTNYYASPEIAQSIRNGSGNIDSMINNDFLLAFYSGVMQGKVAVQFGKTVLSPATQVRNVTSASFFPLANGHIGGNASVTNAFKMIIDDIFGAGKVINEEELIKNIGKKIELGVLDENIVASELKAVLEDLKKDVVINSNRLINSVTNSKWLKTPTRIYAGGDNLWKWYGHEYVKSQLKGIFKNTDELRTWFKEIAGREFDEINRITGVKKEYQDAIEEAAAWYITNTYPTYSKVPPAIQALRKIPLGNFISFPAEMIRTTFNILNVAGKEIASKNPAIRQMGYRRAMGAYTVLGGMGSGIGAIAYNLSGISQEDMDDYKRDYGASWEKNSEIYPITKPEKGKFNFINFSYFSPYDVITAPAKSLMNMFKDRSLKPEEIQNSLLADMIGGPIKQLVNPFISEAILLERVSDVLPAGYGIGARGGVTKTGSQIYSDTDSPDEKLMKSLGHIWNGVQPGGIKTLERIGQGFTGSKDVDPYKELINLFTGVRVGEADIEKTFNYVITDFNRIQQDVFKTENFYTADDWNTRGPKEIADDFRQIQNEAYKEQVKVFQAIETAKKFGVKSSDLYKIMKERKMSGKKITNLLSGRFTPVDYSKGLFEKKIRDLKDREKRRDLEIFTIDRGYLYYYPIPELLKIKNEFFGKRLEVEKPPAEKQLSGIETIPQKITTVSQAPEIKTPPLPQTPAPTVAPASQSVTGNLNVINPLTGLTRTQSTLLSPSEQEIARKLKGIA